MTPRSVEGWTGKLAKVDANGDGKGILEIDVAEDVSKDTWNNASTFSTTR